MNKLKGSQTGCAFPYHPNSVAVVSWGVSSGTVAQSWVSCLTEQVGRFSTQKGETSIRRFQHMDDGPFEAKPRGVTASAKNAAKRKRMPRSGTREEKGAPSEHVRARACQNRGWMFKMTDSAASGKCRASNATWFSPQNHPPFNSKANWGCAKASRPSQKTKISISIARRGGARDFAIDWGPGALRYKRRTFTWQGEAWAFGAVFRGPRSVRRSSARFRSSQTRTSGVTFWVWLPFEWQIRSSDLFWPIHLVGSELEPPQRCNESFGSLSHAFKGFQKWCISHLRLAFLPAKGVWFVQNMSKAQDCSERKASARNRNISRRRDSHRLRKSRVPPWHLEQGFHISRFGGSIKREMK